MADQIKGLVDALNALAGQIQGGIGDSRTALEIYGWNHPPLNKDELASLATRLASRLEAIPNQLINPKYSPDKLISSINSFQANSVPYFWNGNLSAVIGSYLALLQSIESIFLTQLLPQPNWEDAAKDGKLPKEVARKLRNYSTQIVRFDSEFSSLGEKIAYIEQAHQAAIEFPADLDELRSMKSDADQHKMKIEGVSALIEQNSREVQSVLDILKENKKEAEKLIENIEDAYSAATTKGLGEAFQLRATSLNNSMWGWVAGLVLSLGVGALLGGHRVDVLQSLVQNNASSNVVSLNIFLAFLSIAAPIWFAWIATKQIGHRFRLAEDYAFKASVAKAYEGYRREAVRIDPQFAARLFGSALDRIDEAPIRFVENETYGSPWHEFLQWKSRHKQTPSGKANDNSPSQFISNEEVTPQTTSSGA